MLRHSLKQNRKGQTGASAGAVVILTGLIIILYILFLPPAARQELLSNVTPSTNNSNGQPVIPSYDVLLNEHPQTLQPVPQSLMTHQLNSFTLYSDNNDAVLMQQGPTYVSTSRTGKVTFSKDINFNQDYVLTSALLVLDVKETKGNIQVFFNNNQVYDGTPNVGKLAITINDLQQQNTLRIESSNPSFFQFFSDNHAAFNAITLVAKVHNQQFMQSSQQFTLGPEELTNYDSAYMIFSTSCSQKPGPLLVYVNSHLVSSTAFDCQSPVRVDLDKTDLISGKNDVLFKITSGTMSIDAPTVKVSLKQPVLPLYYFQLSQSQYNDLKSNSKDGILHFDFVKGTDDKNFNIVIDGYTYNIDTTNSTYKEDITKYLSQGENYIKLIPRTSLDIVNLQVFLKPTS